MPKLTPCTVTKHARGKYSVEDQNKITMATINVLAGTFYVYFGNVLEKPMAHLNEYNHFKAATVKQVRLGLEARGIQIDKLP